MKTHAQDLIETILKNVTDIQELLFCCDLPELSIEQDVPLKFQANPDFAVPRDAAILACRELLAMLSGSFNVIAAQNVRL